MKGIGLLVPLAALAVSGCKPPEDEFAPAFVPKSVPFQGAVDARFVGDWRSPDGIARLQLDKDGGMRIEQVIHSQNGKSTSKTQGSWRYDQGRLLMNYEDTTLSYAATLSGNHLVLTSKSGMKTNYLRK